MGREFHLFCQTIHGFFYGAGGAGQIEADMSLAAGAEGRAVVDKHLRVAELLHQLLLRQSEAAQVDPLEIGALQRVEYRAGNQGRQPILQYLTVVPEMHQQRIQPFPAALIGRSGKGIGKGSEEMAAMEVLIRLELLPNLLIEDENVAQSIARQVKGLAGGGAG